MPDWNKKFKAEYDYARSYLRTSEDFHDDWKKLVQKLYRLMDPAGFSPSQASQLATLRKKVRKGKTRTEGQILLQAAGSWSAQSRMRAAALKLLRHVYLLNRWGSKKVWIVSLPTEFQNWPSDDLHTRGTLEASARVILDSQSEIFGQEDRKNLATATQQAMSWCHKANIVLANADNALKGKTGRKNREALDLVKRWFADPATTDLELKTYIGKLSKGFKDITGAVNKGHFILTDWVPLRTATSGDDLSFLNSEAFTFASRGEGMDVVYIERSFLDKNNNNVLSGPKNWTRIIVHELTHLVCGTEDVNIGQARYAWYGIGPHSGFPGSAAVRNAESWAFFCADCASQLTEGERNKALKII